MWNISDLNWCRRTSLTVKDGYTSDEFSLAAQSNKLNIKFLFININELKRD